MYDVSPETLRNKIMLLQRENEALRKELRNAKLRENRAKNTSKSLLQQLAEKNLLTAEQEMRLASYEGDMLLI